MTNKLEDLLEDIDGDSITAAEFVQIVVEQIAIAGCPVAFPLDFQDGQGYLVCSVEASVGTSPECTSTKPMVIN